MLENEYKIMIDETKFVHILQQFKMDKSYEQANYYYDTSNYDFYHQGLTFRIRDSYEHKVVQIKYPNISESSFSSRMEKEYVIDEIPLVINKCKVLEYLPCNMIDSDIKMLGCLRTYRWERCLNHNVLLCLDKNTYLGIVDYEIEIEFNDCCADVTYIFDELGIQTGNPIGKYTRFIERNMNLEKTRKSSENQMMLYK